MNRPTVDEDGEMLDYDGNFCIEYFRRVLNADVESDKEEENDEMGRDYGLITRRDFLRRGGCPLSYFPREERVSLRDRGRYGTPDYVDLTGAPVPPANAPRFTFHHGIAMEVRANVSCDTRMCGRGSHLGLHLRATRILESPEEYTIPDRREGIAVGVPRRYM